MEIPEIKPSDRVLLELVAHGVAGALANGHNVTTQDTTADVLAIASNVFNQLPPSLRQRLEAADKVWEWGPYGVNAKRAGMEAGV